VRAVVKSGVRKVAWGIEQGDFRLRSIASLMGPDSDWQARVREQCYGSLLNGEDGAGEPNERHGHVKWRGR
jgi:hypothetical protein